MLRQDNKFKIESIMKHKTFKSIINGSCINYMMIDMFLRCLKCFVRYVCTYWAKAHQFIFHTVGKSKMSAALLGRPWR